MKMFMQSLKMGTVVIITKTEKIYVQIGSAITQSGLTQIIIAAEITPML